MTARCRSCDAAVAFVPSAKSGKAMILDAKPRKGVVVLEPGAWWSDAKPDPDSLAAAKGVTASIDGALVTPGHTDPYDDRPPVALVIDVYTDHHATCPKAADWR